MTDYVILKSSLRIDEDEKWSHKSLHLGLYCARPISELPKRMKPALNKGSGLVLLPGTVVVPFSEEVCGT